MRTFAPSLAKVIAVALPMPDDAPVTSATFPSSLPGIIATCETIEQEGVVKWSQKIMRSAPMQRIAPLMRVVMLKKKGANRYLAGSQSGFLHLPN